MKAVLFKNPNLASASFFIKEDRDAYFYDIRHYHPEFQLTLILKGEGTLFIGDKIDRFEAGDLFLIPPNLPHVFRNDPAYYLENPDLVAHGISVYFKADSFGNTFFDLPEIRSIKNLLNQTNSGLRFYGNKSKVQSSLIEMTKKQDLEKFLDFLSVLESLALELKHERLSGIHYDNPLKESDNRRINVAFKYVMDHFMDTINLSTVSEIANMSPAAFSRFFKQRTRKTFSRFVNEVRIGNACRLLQKEGYQIHEAAYSSGYNNLSNFNRQFKTITGYTPRNYIRKVKA